MAVFETVTLILNSWVLLALAAAAALVWGRLFFKRPVAIIGCISKYDAMVILIAVAIIAAFEVLTMVGDNFPLAVALSRVHRAWLFCALIYVGWRQL